MYLKNTLNFASYNYNASTNTPTLASMKDGTVFEVATAGKVVGTVIDGCALGADSYLLVGDKVVYKNGGYELLTREVKDGTNITIGIGGLFSNFYTANEYTKQRIYSTISLTMLSATVETQSVEVTNPCSGALKIYGSGLIIDFSGTANTNCSLSSDNIYIDNFKVKADHATEYALINKGQLTHSNGFYVENINIVGQGFLNSGEVVSASFGNVNGIGGILATDTVDFRSGAINSTVGYMGVGGKLVAYSINIKGNYRTGYGATCLTSLSPVVGINITGGFDNGNCNDLQTSGISCGGQFNGGISSSNYIAGAITTGGGQFNGGISSSNYIAGAINTGGGQFNGGVSSSNCITGAITTGGGIFHGGSSCSNYIAGAINTGGGIFHGGDNCQTTVFNTITGVGATFQFTGGTQLHVAGAISGYTVAGTQYGIGVYSTTTSAGVIRNQNTATLMSN